MKEIWVDFNDVDEDFMTTSLAKYANARLHPGDQVICSDSEGTECRGLVTDIQLADEETVVVIRLDLLSMTFPGGA